MAVTIKEITTYAEFSLLKDSWNELLASTGADSLFLRHEWFDCWWQSFGRAHKLYILAAYDDNTLRGIAPLMKSTQNGTDTQVIEFMQDSNSPRCDFIVPDGEHAVLSSLIEHLRTKKGTPWEFCRLSNIPEESWTVQALESISRAQKIRIGVLQGLRSPVIKIAGTWDSFVETKSSRFSKTLRYCVNKAKRMGKTEILRITDVRDYPGLIKTLGLISAHSWKKAQAGDLARTPENESFFVTLTNEASKHGWLSVWLMRATELDIPVAYEYHLCYKNEEFALRADFDMQYGEYSPGSALEAHIIRRAFEIKRKSYDLCGNDYAYKMRWTDQIRAHVTVELYNDTPRAAYLFFMRHHLKPLGRAIGLGRIKRLLTKKGNA